MRARRSRGPALTRPVSRDRILDETRRLHKHAFFIRPFHACPRPMQCGVRFRFSFASEISAAVTRSRLPLEGMPSITNSAFCTSA